MIYVNCQLNTFCFDHSFSFQFHFIVLVVTVIVGSMSGFGSCGRLKQGRGCRNLTDTQCLLRASRKYLLVENFLLENNNTHSNRPVPAGAREGTTNCPWIWTLDDNPN